jgi:hypothetical protein
MYAGNFSSADKVNGPFSHCLRRITSTPSKDFGHRGLP